MRRFYQYPTAITQPLYRMQSQRQKLTFLFFDLPPIRWTLAYTFPSLVQGHF